MSVTSTTAPCSVEGSGPGSPAGSSLAAGCDAELSGAAGSSCGEDDLDVVEDAPTTRARDGRGHVLPDGPRGHARLGTRHDEAGEREGRQDAPAIDGRGAADIELNGVSVVPVPDADGHLVRLAGAPDVVQVVEPVTAPVSRRVRGDVRLPASRAAGAPDVRQRAGNDIVTSPSSELLGRRDARRRTGVEARAVRSPADPLHVGEARRSTCGAHRLCLLRRERDHAGGDKGHGGKRSQRPPPGRDGRARRRSGAGHGSTST